MTYFENADRVPERAGKVIGDLLAVTIVAFVVILLAYRLFF